MIFSSNIKEQSKSMFSHSMGIAVLFLVGCLMVGHRALADRDGANGEHDNSPPRSAPRSGRPTEFSGSQNDSDEECGVSPRALVNFANGDSFNFRTEVTFLTSSACRAASTSIRMKALGADIAFNDAYPYRLTRFLPSGASGEFEDNRRPADLKNLSLLEKVDSSLASLIPETLREHPLSTQNGLTILGQLALLSPDAAKAVLGSMIQQALISGTDRMERAPAKEKSVLARDLASSLKELGADKPEVISQLSSSVEEMAALAQADSLGRLMPSLASASQIDASLIPAFNLSAAAINRGVRRGTHLYTSELRESLFRNLVRAIASAIKGNGTLDSGAADLNEAMATLENARKISPEVMTAVWRKVIYVLGTSQDQAALADLVGRSLTPEMTYLRANDVRGLIAASRNYPSLARAVQINFTLAWKRQWRALQSKELSVAKFNRLKSTYFAPLVSYLLQLDPSFIDPYWLRVAINSGLVQDDQIERRFPRQVLAYLDRQNQASAPLASQTGLEPQVNAMAENFAVLWTLSNVQLPALLKWVRKYDQ